MENELIWRKGMTCQGEPGVCWETPEDGVEEDDKQRHAVAQADASNAHAAQGEDEQELHSCWKQPCIPRHIASDGLPGLDVHVAMPCMRDEHRTDAPRKIIQPSSAIRQPPDG